MPGNRDLAVAENYHALTKHSYASVRADRHFLDWGNQPLPFKVYPALEPIPLPRDLPQTGVAALSALTQPAGEGAAAEINLGILASLLFFSAGITRRRKYPGGEIFFRAAACTGALYEIELYVVCGDLPGLPAGVYHFSVGDFALRRLRAGDHRGALVEATAAEPAVQRAPLILVCTATYWRNAWKYQARTYRHFGWDNGTLLANLLAMGAAWGLPARVCCGFVDEQVNRLLGLDTRREVAFSLVAVGAGAGSSPEPPELRPLKLETVPLSAREVDYPLMRAMHEASSLDSPEHVAAWRSVDAPARRSSSAEPSVPLQSLPEGDMPRDTIEQVILRRGSCRRFSRELISFEKLSTALRCASAGLPADFLGRDGALLNDMYVLALGVEGLPSGAYALHAGRGELDRLREGDFRAEAAYLALEQELGGGGAADVFFLAEMTEVLRRLGNRGYRAMQLEAGILGGRLYLAAYALGFAATGLTFYDDEVSEFFSPHARGKETVFLVALGKSARRRAR
jgi:SagB-type dehydrogenase family enzyme